MEISFKYCRALSILLLSFSSVICSAQEIVFLEEGREIQLKILTKTVLRLGEKVKFKVKYDVYTEDNLVIASESEVVGKIISKNNANIHFAKIEFVNDVHGNKIKVRTAKNGRAYLPLLANQTEFSIYVDEGFWFSY